MDNHVHRATQMGSWVLINAGWYKFRDNAIRLQLHALAYNLANFVRTLALPKEVEPWSMIYDEDPLRRRPGKPTAR